MDVWRALEILGRRKWLLLASVAITCMLAFGFSRIVGSTWVATVKLMSPQSSDLSSLPGKQTSDATVPEYGPYAKEAAANQAAVYEAVAKSREVVSPVLAKVPGERFDKDLLDRISVSAGSTPRLYELSVSGPNPDVAGALANGLAEALVDRYQQITSAQAHKVVALLERQVAVTDQNLRKARDRYEAYTRGHKVRGLSGGPSTLDMALARLGHARQSRDEVAEKLAAARAELQVKMRDLAATPQMIPAQATVDTSPLIQQLRSSLVGAEMQLEQMRASMTEDHPSVVQAKAARDELAARLQTETRRLMGRTRSARSDVLQTNPVATALNSDIAQLKQEVAGLAAQQSALSGTLSESTADIDKLKGGDTTASAMTSELAELTDASAALAVRLNNARIAVDVSDRQNPLTIADPVSDINPPMRPSQNRTLKLVLLGALCSLIGVSALLIALDSIDRRLRTVQEAETALPAKVLAAIPQPMGAVTYTALARATELHPQSPHAEAYRFLGLHLLSLHNPSVRSLMVLSAKAAQGSTTALTNLGITLAQAGRRVILVDANVRTAELHLVFEIENGWGFGDVLVDLNPETLDRAIRPTSVPNLSVITAGTLPDNPWQLFRSPALPELGRLLLERADFVLYDTPSAVLFTDAFNLAPVADAALLSLRAFEPLTGSERRLLDLLEQAGVKLIGTVLNDVPASVLERYSNYQHYYSGGHHTAVTAIPASHADVAVDSEPLIIPNTVDERPPGTPA